MKTWHKHALWIGPLLAGGVIIYVLYRKNRVRDVSATDSSAPPVKAAPAPKNSSFPLKKGVRDNEYVKKLQSALGITADGIFGDQTEAALRNAAGTSIVADEKQLNDIIAKVKSTATTASKYARAKDLTEKFQTGKFAIQVIESSWWSQVVKDAFGAYNPTGLGIQLSKGMKLSKADYSVTDYTKLGNLIIYCNKGGNQGSYIGDPATVTLVEQATAPTPANPSYVTFGIL